MSEANAAMRLSLQQKEQFFHEVHSSLRAGRSLPEILQRMAGGRHGDLQRAATAMLADAAETTARSYFSALPGAFAELDREVVSSGEVSGRLETVTAYLRDYYGALAKARRIVLAKLTYPLFLLHFGAVLVAAPTAVQGGLRAFAAEVLMLLGIFYVLLAGAWILATLAVKAARVSVTADRLLLRIPGVAGARLALIGSRFCLVLGLLVRSGASILTSMDRAGSASGSALFRRGAAQAAEHVRRGGALGASVIATKAFPEDIDRAFQTGEEAGRLDDEMTRQGDRYTEKLYGRLTALSTWIPLAIYVAILGALGWKIIQFWAGYYQGIREMFDQM